MSKLMGRVERLEKKIGIDDEPLVLETHSGPVTIPGGQRELKAILEEVSRKNRPLVKNAE
jgi:hypothetical protein